MPSFMSISWTAVAFIQPPTAEKDAIIVRCGGRIINKWNNPSDKRDFDYFE